MDTHLMEGVRRQIIVSLSLSRDRKMQLLQLLPSLPEEKLLALRDIFDEEARRRNEILTEAAKTNPHLAKDIKKIADKSLKELAKQMEAREHSRTKEETEALLEKLNTS